MKAQGYGAEEQVVRCVHIRNVVGYIYATSSFALKMRKEKIVPNSVRTTDMP